MGHQPRGGKIQTKQRRKRDRHIKRTGYVVVVAIFAVIGTFLLIHSHAQTPTVSIEPENGTIGSCASKVSDTTASGSAAVELGTCTTNGFVHPGVLLGTAQINFVRGKVVAGTAPWSTFFTQMQTVKPALGTEAGVPFASLNYVAHAANNVECSSGNSADASAACNDETNDGIAAYADTLMYLYGSSNRDAYAQKAIQILNAWGATFRNRVYNGAGDSASNNAYLQASWAGAVFARTAELIRYTYTPPSGETALNVANLTTMFNDAYVPYANTVWSGGGANWLMSFDDATMSIGIFENNTTLYNNAVARWKAQVPSIIYMAGDVNPYSQLQGSPIPSPGTVYDKATTTAASMKTYWHSPSKYISGLEGETCRDPAHMSMGLGSMINVAETARLQGDDLYNYSDFKTRIATGVELNTGWLVSFLGGKTPSNWVCPAAMTPTSYYGWQDTFEIAYNEFANRLGMSMPNTNALLTTYSRPSTYKASHNSEFEGLTSYGTP